MHFGMEKALSGTREPADLECAFDLVHNKALWDLLRQWDSANYPITRLHSATEIIGTCGIGVSGFFPSILE